MCIVLFIYTSQHTLSGEKASWEMGAGSGAAESKGAWHNGHVLILIALSRARWFT